MSSFGEATVQALHHDALCRWPDRAVEPKHSAKHMQQLESAAICVGPELVRPC